MAKTKRRRAQSASRVIGGVNAAEVKREMLAGSVRGTIEKRHERRFRLRLGKHFEVAVGRRLLVDADFETVLAVVTAVHPHNLIDVEMLAGLDDSAHRVSVRRAPF